MHKKNLFVTIEKLFVRVATHKTDIGRDISTDLIFLFLCVHININLYLSQPDYIQHIMDFI